MLLEERLQQRLIRHLLRIERYKHRFRMPRATRAHLLVRRVRRNPARIPDRRRVHARHLPEQSLRPPEATQREHCRLDPVRERRHQRRPEHLVPLRHLERPILPSRQRLFRRNHLHITLEQLHGQYLRHFYDTTSLLRSPSNRHLLVPRSPAFAPRPSYLVLRTSYFVPRTSYLAFVPLDLHHHTKPVVVVPVVGRDAAPRRAAAHLHSMPPR